MKRSGEGPEDFVTPILKRHMSRHSEIRARDLARALECDESRISHIKAGRQRMAMHEVVEFCDVYNTMEPFSAALDRLGYDLVERPRQGATVATLRSHVAGLMRDVGLVAVELEAAMVDGHLDAEEVAALGQQLQAVIEGARAARARLPKATP